MNVISRKLLRTFANSIPERRRHAAAFDDWYRVARRAVWRNFQETRATFGQTDVATGHAGRTATIFDVGGNKYRIIAQLDYRRQVVQIRAVMDHAEYDRRAWRRLF